MRPAPLLWLGLTTLLPASALAQTSFDTPLDPRTSRPVRETPDWVQTLEATEGTPPCGEDDDWGRSTLDGGLASRGRPDDLPCRTVWDRTIRFELGLVGGGLTERSDGAWGGLSVSLGLRLHEAFSAYYLSLLMFGAWDRDPGTTVEVAAYNAFLFELSFVPRLSLALGPSIDLGAGCDIGVGQAEDSCSYAPYYGLHSRVTVEVAETDFGGLTLTGDVHATLSEPDPRATLLLGVGFRF